MFLVVFMLLSCNRPLFRNNKVKVLADDLKLLDNLIKTIGLDESIRSVVRLATFPVVEIVEGSSHKLEKILKKYKDDRKFCKFLSFVNSMSERKSTDGAASNCISKEVVKRINTSSKEGVPIIHLVINKNMSTTLNKMIEKGVDIYAKDENGTTPLMLAIQRDNIGIFDKIIAKMDEKHSDKDKTIDNENFKIKGNKRELANRLNEKDKNNFTALHWAILSKNSSHFVFKLLDFGASIKVSDCGVNELHFASLAGNYQAVLKIIEKYTEIYKDKEEFRTKILEVTSDKYKRTSFHFAAISGSKEIYRHLSEKISEDEPERRVALPLDYEGATPLHYLSLKNVLDPLIRYEREKKERAVYQREEIVDDELSNSRSEEVSEKLGLLRYILSDDHKLVLENLHYVSKDVEVAGNIIDKTSAILRETLKGLNMLHYAAHFSNKEVFEESIKQLKDKRDGHEILISKKDLKTKENDKNIIIDRASIFSLSYNSFEKDVFDYISQNLENNLGINFEEILNTNGKVHELKDKNNREVLFFRILKNEQYDEAMLNLYMLTIGYKLKKNSDEKSYWSQYIDIGRVSSFFDKLKKCSLSVDSKMFLSNSHLGVLLGLNYKSAIEIRDIDLENENRFFDEVERDESVELVFNGSEEKYFCAAICRSNPYKALGILFNKFGRVDYVKALNTPYKTFRNRGSEIKKRVIDVLVNKNLYRLTRFIVEKGAEFLFEGEKNVVHIAAEEGYLEILDFFYREAKNRGIKCPKDNNDKWPINYAIEKENLQCVERILKISEGNDIFSEEIKDNMKNLVDLAMKTKPQELNLNILNHTILDFIIGKEYENSDRDNILSISIIRGSEDCFRYVLGQCSKEMLNHQNNDNETPLHTAVEFSKWEFVKELLNAGADPNIEDKEEYTPIFRLINKISNLSAPLGEQDERIIEDILRDEKIKIDKRYKKNETILELALRLYKEEKSKDTLERREYVCSLLTKLSLFILEREDISYLLTKLKSLGKSAEILNQLVSSNSLDLVKLAVEVYGGKDIKVFSKRSKYPSLIQLAIEGKEGRSFDQSFIALFDKGADYGEIDKIKARVEFLIYVSIVCHKKLDSPRKLNALKSFTIKECKNAEFSIDETFLQKNIREFCEEGEDGSLLDYLKHNKDNDIVKDYVREGIISQADIDRPIGEISV